MPNIYGLTQKEEPNAPAGSAQIASFELANVTRGDTACSAIL
jgi:hypothetical protein